MTPTTTEQARQQLIAKIRHANRPAAEQKAIAGLGLPLADKVEALTKERDEYAKAADTMAIQHKVERDALAAAGKLALDALEVATTPLASDRQEVLAAITALRRAGVQ